MNNEESIGVEKLAPRRLRSKGLELCWLPEHGRWSHIYHLDNRDQPNKSVPYSDVFYTLNVLLGLARVRHVPQSISLLETFQRNVSQLIKLPVPKYAFGMALWAAQSSDWRSLPICFIISKSCFLTKIIGGLFVRKILA